jgi:alkaline phosphatase isozyme conversion protein
VARRLTGLLLALLAAAACGAPAAPANRTPSASAPSATSGSSAAEEPSPYPAPITSFGSSSRRHIVALTSIGLRVEGTKGEQQAAAYISDALKSAGLEPELRPFTAGDFYGKTVHSNNVVAVKPGDSPREIIVGAHYDSTAGGVGADDNASGVAVMLEMAELLRGRSTPYTIRFVAFGAEEGGEVGSGAFVGQMSKAERANTVGFVNLDSVIAGDFEYVYSDEEALAVLRDWTLAWASANGLDLKTIRNVDLGNGAGGGSGDYFAFQQAKIPFVYFEATDWTLGRKDGYTQVSSKYGVNGELRHTKFDTLAYLDANFPGRVDAYLNMVGLVLFHLLTEYR